MNWYIKPDDQQMVATVRDFARARLLPIDRRCDRDESSICQALPELAELGLMAIRVQEKYGGLGLSRLTYAAIIHELAYASPSAAVTLAVHSMVGELLQHFANPRVRENLLPNWGQAENLGAFAISEPGAGSDPSASETCAVQRNGQWVINGSKMWITNGLSGRWFVTLVQTGKIGDKNGLRMILVDGRQEGLERLKIMGKMGIRGSETVSLHLTSVAAPLDHLFLEEGSGLKLSLIALDGGRIGIAAQSAGIAEACLDEMVAYAKQRVQFDQPIARFQAVQKMIADSRVELEAAWALIARACDLADRGLPYTSAAAQAKLCASELATRVADRAVQIHGGSGYVVDSRVEQLYRDARITRIYEGTSEIQRLVIARELLRGGMDC